MMTTQQPVIQDADQRRAALDAGKSFIVQAPAGSGKTELLIQRFLVLLSIVKQPEEVLAITFTKKSAAEMRSRIIHALKNALMKPEPETDHGKTTWHLARKVLAQDKKFNWRILENPNQLRIQTIDSFNSYLTRHLPVLSQFGSTPEISDNARDLYQQAVQEFLSHLEENVEWADDIATLLLHLDNDLSKVEGLLINLLQKRDQWLPYITLNAADPMLRDNLEFSLAAVVSDILATIQKSFPKQHAEELLYLLRYAAGNVENDNPDSPIAACTELDELPGTEYEDSIHWLGIRELLFTKSGDFRRRIDKDIGFYAVSNFKKAEEKAFASDMKARVLDLINQLSGHEDLQNNLEELRKAPDIFYQPAQWKILEALHHILRLVVAQLKVVFQQHGQIDYIENAQAALTALGTDEEPTDLTLALDYQFKHILIDEFQDTSNSQFRLLGKITAGWETNDGRTLFLVGDPMQSIYRFREAEVGLFIRARNHGIGNIHLVPLTLSVNFRSVPGIVNWVNAKFPRVFPSYEDIASGAVSYSQSVACKPAEDHDKPTVHLHPSSNEDTFAQANKIVELIQAQKLAAPNEKIAILVRSRPQLENIIIALKAAHIPFRAINIDPLTARPFIQDLMALTRALLHPADRIAWLAILRAPWCGLSLRDLLILSGNDNKTSISERLQSVDILHSLSVEGQQRLQRILPHLNAKLQERRRHSLRTWIESTWLLFGGPGCVEQAADLDDATAYFNLLDHLDCGGDLIDLDALKEHVAKLFAAPNTEADESLQIMTIHNSKGLEFDTVILPHLERRASLDDKQLLLWMERPRTDEKSDLLLAPIHAVGEDTDKIYEYIKRQQVLKNNFEKSRLLYVAVTRAKKQLHLFFNLNDKNGASTNSLLEKLWPAIKDEFAHLELKSNAEKAATEEEQLIDLPIKRLTLDWKNPVHENRLPESFTRHQKMSGYLLPDHTPKKIGTLIHQILQQISLRGHDWWLNESSQHQQEYISTHLLRLGMLPFEIESSIQLILSGIQKTLNDAKGQWLLQRRAISDAEFPITAVIDGNVTQLVIDRTFVDENNVRWIIDYKSTQDTENNLENFFTEQETEYKKQLMNYYLAMKEIDDREIRMGLYFPLIPAWKEISIA